MATMNAPERIAVEFRVVGRVQGVAYRWSCMQAAERHGASGWVRNRPDGSVQGWFEGSPETVQAMIEWAGRGPDAAVVTNVETNAASPAGFSSFQIRR